MGKQYILVDAANMFFRVRHVVRGEDAETKVDRSAAYMMRYIAKNIVASEKSSWANVQISYAIGLAEPMSFYVECDDIDVARELTVSIPSLVDLTPKGIIERFNLYRPIYSSTTNYGHFGKDYLPWEKIDLF